MSAAAPNKAGRILWLGNHALLLNTELPRLRALGFEVFHAPCRRVVRQHQSAMADWKQGPTTLDPSVYARLADADLYFTPIEPDMFALLNEHFSAAVVAIQATWVAELLRGFAGKIVYRTYGDSRTVSEQLWQLGAFRALIRRENFWFVPFASEYARQEQAWVRARETVVPYCVDALVAGAIDSWAPDREAPEVMLSCPNIKGNPFFWYHFAELKQAFNQPVYRIYGVQPEAVQDPQVVGTKPFADVINRYRSATVLLYTYRFPGVCFLPPIEMMIVGGPVVFVTGSLLDRMMGPNAPGRARDLLEAREKCERLLAGDAELERAIIRSQMEIRTRYLPDHVWPPFDDAMRSILGAGWPSTEHATVTWSVPSIGEGQIVALAYHPTLTPRLDCGRYVTTEATVARLVQILRVMFARDERRKVVVVCHREGLEGWYGLLAQFFPASRLVLLCLDDEQPEQPPSPYLPKGEKRTLMDRARNIAARAISPGVLRRLNRASARFAPPIDPGTLRRNLVVSLHPDCEIGLAAIPLMRLYSDLRTDEAVALSIAEGLRG
jgi:hypothetical protein